MAVLLLALLVMVAAQSVSKIVSANVAAEYDGARVLADRADVERLMLNQENLSKQFEAILGQWHTMEMDWERTKSDLEREKQALQIEKEHWKRAAELLKEQLVNQFEATVKKSKGTQEYVGDDELNMLDPTAWEKWRSLHRANTENSRSRPENSGANPESTWFNSGLSKLEQLSEEMVPRVVDVNVVAEHEVASRSDDVSQLETVMTQHSHRLGVLDAEIQALKNADQALENAQGSIYTHWGHSTCPSTSHLVYSGVVGGSYYTADNAAPNYLCLPLNPVLSSHSIPSRFAELYGAEYETYDSHDDSDPVCAVCRSQRPTTVMIPATNVCSAGWTLEYSGYLMANSRGHNAGYEYVCVNTVFEDRVGSGTSLDGALFYFTVTVCGSLPCPPYVDHKVVPCVVCSK